MAKENKNDLDAMAKDLSKLSDAISGLSSAMDGKIIIEEGYIVDTSLPIEVGRLSSDQESAMREYEYLQERKQDKMSESSIKRVARDYLESKSNGILDIDADSGGE